MLLESIQINGILLKINEAHCDWIFGLDYNKILDIITSGSDDRSIYQIIEWKIFTDLKKIIPTKYTQSFTCD